MFSIGAVFKVKADGQLAGMIGKLVDIQIIDGHEVATLDTNDGNVLCVYLDRLEATNEAMPLNEDEQADNKAIIDVGMSLTARTLFSALRERQSYSKIGSYHSMVQVEQWDDEARYLAGVIIGCVDCVDESGE